MVEKHHLMRQINRRSSRVHDVTGVQLTEVTASKRVVPIPLVVRLARVLLKCHVGSVRQT
jgi:hypothetical protein